ncbi:polyhomeotic-like protein 3 [Chanos chanos]|uniref:Polyhomeotic-like protein 3 n=1 Tax=Chanos chanos TaxID=29144 RepID=A0A6J2VEW5_CHACN|nr:polyhomeotic-like protein 3 [Chanos chanos]
MTALTSTTAVTSNTNISTSTNISRSTSPAHTQANSTPLSSASVDRQAVQVIQQAIQRPQGMAAQYLQQMYTAQQHHIMLQTAAIQQQHQQNLTVTQSLTTTQQASQTGSRQTSSSPPSTNGNVVQSASVTLPTSPLTAQPTGRIQGVSSTATGGAISQQAMLLGNGSPTGSQAQMYLRTQMLILTPAATVAAVQSELPAISSVSSQSTSTQVRHLALCTHLPGALATTHSVQLKPSSQSQTVVPSLPKMSLGPLRPAQVTRTSAETSRATCTPIQSHALIRHQLHCTHSQKGAPHQLIIQQSTTTHRQVQPIALRVSTQDNPTPPLSLLTRTTPTSATVLSQHSDVLSVPSTTEQPTSLQQAVVVSSSVLPHSCTTLPDPPPLHLGPAVEPLPQPPSLTCPPPLTMALPRLAQPPPASLQRLSLRSVQALAVQSDQMLVAEDELPVAEALVQLPFQNLPPPQTMAVDLKVQPAIQTEAPSVNLTSDAAEKAQQSKVEGTYVEGLREEGRSCPQSNRTPTPPISSPSPEPQRDLHDEPVQPDSCTAVLDLPCVSSTRSVIRSPEDSTYANSSPPPFLSAVVRSTSRPPTASLPGSPEGQPSQPIVRPHILTHLIEGFVIREGLEPFPVGRSSLITDQQATLPEDMEMSASGEQAPNDCLIDTEQPENSTDSDDMDDIPADDEQAVESLSDVLQCEFCGKEGYAQTFLRSKRFCSMTCVRRFNVSCTKRLALLKSDKVSRWPHRAVGRRGRPPSCVNGGSREHFLRQLSGSCGSEDIQQISSSREEAEEDEDSPPGPMTTRLRVQAERERELERGKERDQGRRGSFSSSDGLSNSHSNPSQWTVEQVWSYINSLPGCQDIANEFRSQEIDGQALLLLTEDHLMSAMNIKLGPALKICAQINSLKEP